MCERRPGKGPDCMVREVRWLLGWASEQEQTWGGGCAAASPRAVGLGLQSPQDPRDELTTEMDGTRELSYCSCRPLVFIVCIH